MANNNSQGQTRTQNGGKHFAVNQSQYSTRNASTNPYVMKTRSGLLPDEDRVPYSVKTAQIIAYLQKKVDIMIADINNNLPDGVAPLGDIPLKGYTIKFTSTHYPIMLIMPKTVEFNPHRKPKKQNGPRTADVDISQDISDEESGRDKLTLLKPLYEVIQPFMYEKGFFRNPNKCQQMRLSNQQRQTCDRFATPKRARQKDGGSIMVMLDPFAIIHEMLEINGDLRTFFVMMCDAQKIQDGEFKYKVKRTFKKAKKGKKGISELNALLRMGSGGSGATLK